MRFFFNHLFPKFYSTGIKSLPKRLVLATGMLLLGFIILTGQQEPAAGSRFCNSCHEMRPHYLTWQESSHKKVACVRCHAGSGLVNAARFKIGGIYKSYRHAQNSVPVTFTVSRPVNTAVCEQCHSPNRLVNASGDLLIPHNRHLEKKVPCVTCHDGVVHGRLMRRSVIKEIPYAEWTVQVAREQTRARFLRPRMDTCMTCHQERGITTDCEACHKIIYLPDSHKQADWDSIHGLDAREDAVSCLKCHASDRFLPGMAQRPVLKVVREIDFCYECHSVRPPSHAVEDWKTAHKGEVLAKGKESCYACHNVKKTAAGRKITRTYCNMCHWFVEPDSSI